MVGFDANAKKRLTDSEHAIAGGLTGAITRAISQPLDVVKIRFQLQVEPLKKSSQAKYWSVTQAVRTIIREEGITALWKGHMPAQYLSITYGLTQMSCFEILTREVWVWFPVLRENKFQPVAHFMCGGIAGLTACVASYPFDIVRTRLIAQGEPKIYTNMTYALKSIVKHQGLSGLFYGLSPVILQIAPQTGIQFSLYTLLSRFSKGIRETDSSLHSVISNLVVGSLSGIGAKTAVYPLDVAKKRLQMTGVENSRISFGQVFTTTGLINCLIKTAREEGAMALMKGLSPSLLKAGVVSAMYFSVYEYICSGFLKWHSTSDL